MSEHTPEPWATAYRERRDGQWAQEIFDADGELIATLAWYSIKSGNSTHTNREENARRIVACVNACRGMETDTLEAVNAGERPILVTKKDRHDELAAHALALRERDEARAMVKRLAWALRNVDVCGDYADLIDEAEPSDIPETVMCQTCFCVWPKDQPQCPSCHASLT